MLLKEILTIGLFQGLYKQEFVRASNKMNKGQESFFEYTFDVLGSNETGFKVVRAEDLPFS